VVCRLPARIPITHWYAVADHLVKGLIVLLEEAGEIMVGEFEGSLFDRFFGQLRIQADNGAAQITFQHHLASIGPSQGAIRPEGLLIVGVDTLLAEHLFQVLGKGSLHQSIFAVDVSDHADPYRTVHII
jgi:hypothetical protein